MSHRWSRALGAAYRETRWRNVALVWAAVGTMNWLLDASALLARGHIVMALRFLTAVAASAAFWAAVTPALFGLAHELQRQPRARRVIVHVLASSVVTCGDTAWSFFLVGAIFQLPHLGFVETYLPQLFSDGFSYLCVVTFALYRDRRVRAAELEVELARAELAALRMQLRPHFFFNTLHAIASLVRTGRGGEAVEIIGELGELVRVVLREDAAPEVPLGDELRWIERYLQIERVRFGDRLRVDIAVDAAARAALVPPFILQPLVENAIRHGLDADERPGCIAIAGSIASGRLHLAVRDTGPGPRRDVTDGFGLAATRDRLRRLFGETHAFAFGPAGPGGGAVAEIEIPVRRSGAPS